MRKMLQRCICSGIVTGLLAWPSLASADQDQYVEDAGMGTATVAANVLYIPAKLGYALLGGLTGGAAYVLTGANQEVAERIWNPSLGGNYILSADHLRGAEPIYFSAPTVPSTGDR